MAKELRIYPGIGIARLGNHPTDYFIAPEVPGMGPLEPTVDGTFTPVQSFRAGGAVRRQGARFRIFEVETDATGGVVQHREITADDATIVWHVELANQKADAGHFVSESTPEDTGNKRNPNVPSDQLIIKPVFPSISGKDQSAVASAAGKFKGTDVYLGELKTDSKGRLIVLGGRGVSASVPAGRPIGNEPNPSGNTFANNEFWHDDISDGPVSAIVTLPGATAVEVKDAWVVVAPPDFAPLTRAVTTLYDVACHAAIRSHQMAAPAQPSFKRDILPVLMSAAGYRWTSGMQVWKDFPTDWAALGSKANGALRDKVRQDLDKIAGGAILNLSLTGTQIALLDQWRDGNFIEDFSSPDPVHAITPEGIDKASLEQAVGGGFFPGIEAGIMTTYREFYAAPFRVKRVTFTHGTRTITPTAGFITRNMACPWQADFIKCAQETPTAIWWPAQRPINVKRVADPTTTVSWARGIADHRDLAARAMELGFVRARVAGSADGLYEADRSMPEP